MERYASWLVLVAATLIAVVSARPFAGAWNDGSRLATVECLVDSHTLVIDHSLFVEVPERSPYDPGNPLLARGTADKLWIHGHFYSDKSPVPALYLALVYRGWKAMTGFSAREQPGFFCWTMTFASSGLAYIAAVWCIYLLGRHVGLSVPTRLVLTLSFGLATVAPVYARHVNNHLLMLGVTAPLMLSLAWLAHDALRPAKWLLVWIGTLTGVGYTMDLGVGPALVACAAGLVAFRCRRGGPVFWFSLAAAPWLVLHHVVNYSVGGTWKPANAMPEYLQWPGSPFTVQNMTGGWNHTPGHFIVYALALLFGKQGFVGHNLPLFLVLPSLALLIWRRVAEWPELLYVACFCGGTWLIYALTSTNYSGQCCSVRWFVPLLAPAFYALAVLLRHEPRASRDLLILGGWGLVLMTLAWNEGPWLRHMVPLYWPIQAAALICWGMPNLMASWRWGRRESNPHLAA